jgi:hypothetical protein
MAEGESLNEISRSEGMPPASTVRGWVLDDQEGFSARYARARELQAEYWADEILEISDDGVNDWMERALSNGKTETVVHHEHVTRSRLRGDSRKWLLAKLRPGTYGDKVQHANAAGDGNASINVYQWAKPDEESK